MINYLHIYVQYSILDIHMYLLLHIHTPLTVHVMYAYIHVQNVGDDPLRGHIPGTGIVRVSRDD